MDYRTITGVALRISGVLILVNTLSAVPGYFYGYTQQEGVSVGAALLASLAGQVIPLVVALALIYFPARLGSALASHTPTDEQRDLTARIGEVAFIALGFYFVANALFDAAFYGAKFWLLKRDAASHDWEGDLPVPYDTIAGLVYCAVETAVGLLLMFSARGLYGIIRRLRETKPKPGNPA